jgi:hypothetical protein
MVQPTMDAPGDDKPKSIGVRAFGVRPVGLPAVDSNISSSGHE